MNRRAFFVRWLNALPRRPSTAVSALAMGIACVVGSQGSDLDFVIRNMGRRSMAPYPEVTLSPQLTVIPGRQTLLTDSPLTFVAAGGTNRLTWFMIDNPSGGRIAQVSPTSIVYRAGTTSSVIDVIEAWDGENRFGRACINIITKSESEAAGKAIVVAGRRSADDPLWPNTDYLANCAFVTLLYRAYDRDNVQYLSPVPGRDVDRNGGADDIDLATTYGNVALTFTNWAFRAGVSNLFVYLVDHGQDSGGNGYFRLNASDLLPARDLDAWLDALQNRHQTRVTLVIDSCYAASLLDELSYTGRASRIVLASSGTNEPAYFVAGGLVSFSDVFLNGIMLGFSIERAWEMARDAMSVYQQGRYYDNGDGRLGSNAYLGATFVAVKDIPQVGMVCGNQLLTHGTTARLWADDVVARYPVERVWCAIVSPSHTADPAVPVSNIPELDLVYNERTGRYEGQYDGFSEEGTYKIVYYARDYWNSVSLPKQAFVIQSRFDERAVVVNAARRASPHWTALNTIANRAYHTLRRRWFDPDSIQYLSPDADQDVDGDGTNDVDAVPSLAALGFAVTNWAATASYGGPADKLTVYLLGEAENGQMRMNDTEWLSASALDSWLDAFQASNQPAVVVMEFDGAGAYLPRLTPPQGAERICVASTAAGRKCAWLADGHLSFSWSFLSLIFSGCTVGDAFAQAQQTMRLATGRLRQEAQLDDDGDGVANRVGRDGLLACRRYVGSAFKTGDDGPTIGRFASFAALSQDERAGLLWAADVTDMDGVSNVWCIVTPPDFDGTGGVGQVDLRWNESANRFEAAYTNFTQFGEYALTFLARDVKGEFATPAIGHWIRARSDADSDGDGMDDLWEARHFENVTNAMAAADADRDGLSNWAEWLAGCNPRDRRSLFTAGARAATAQRLFVVTWSTVPGRAYSIHYSTNLAGGFWPLTSGLPASVNAFTDRTDRARGPKFYRVGVGGF